MNRWISVLVLPLYACGASDSPLPSIVSVTPASMVANASVDLTVELEGTFPLQIAYGKESARLVTAARVGIGEQTFDILGTEEMGYRLLSNIPADMLSEGSHEFRVEFTDGRHVKFENGFVVEPPPTVDPPITGLSIDTIANQLRLQPFRISLRAQGPDAELFQGRVELSVSAGTISPTQSGPFAAGQRLENVTLDAPGGTFVTITAQHKAGHSVTSNSFRVLAP